MYVDGAVCRVLEIGRDGEVDEVIDRVADLAEFVDHLVPDKVRLVPVVSDDDRPSAKLFEHFLQRLQAHFLGVTWRFKFNTLKLAFINMDKVKIQYNIYFIFFNILI